MLIFVPGENAKVLDDIIINTNTQQLSHEYDLIVLDRSWAQARKFASWYFPESHENDDQTAANVVVKRVKLSDEAINLLENEGSTQSGHQLRRHCTSRRQVGTFEATRLFSRDWSHCFPEEQVLNSMNGIQFWGKIQSYRQIANHGAARFHRNRK
jgi:hypothetical protein